MLDFAWPLARRLLFRLDAEQAHEHTMRMLGAMPVASGLVLGAMTSRPAPSLARTVAGLRLPSPIGLAAGLDKNGVAIPVWPRLGFGFVEVGTVTAHAQPGNPPPRLLRLESERALVNRMGFNNEGSETLAARLRALRDRGLWPEVPIGVNIGKSKVTPLEEATADYVTSARRVAGLADYVTINVSSPNTPGLRDLQSEDALRSLIPAVVDAARAPVFLKLAPDLPSETTAELVDLAIALGISGIIATNSTTRRDMLDQDPGFAGGLSGRPLWPIARSSIATALRAASGRVPVVGVGGIERSEQVLELLRAGCAAVQLYTALIYEGPGLPRRLNRDLAEAST